MSTIRPEIAGRRRGTTCTASEWIELQRIIDLKEASRLSGLSIDSIKRHHSDKIIDLSPRRRGMRLGSALMLAGE